MELTLGGETLGEVKINRGILNEGDSLQPILFVITLKTLPILLRNMKLGYVIGEFRVEICNLLFIDD